MPTPREIREELRARRRELEERARAAAFNEALDGAVEAVREARPLLEDTPVAPAEAFPQQWTEGQALEYAYMDRPAEPPVAAHRLTFGPVETEDDEPMEAEAPVAPRTRQEELLFREREANTALRNAIVAMVDGVRDIRRAVDNYDHEGHRAPDYDRLWNGIDRADRAARRIGF